MITKHKGVGQVGNLDEFSESKQPVITADALKVLAEIATDYKAWVAQQMAQERSVNEIAHGYVALTNFETYLEFRLPAVITKPSKHTELTQECPKEDNK